MFHLHPSMSYWFYPYPTDMRKSFYTLSGIVTNSMGRHVQDGEVFIFINRTRNCMKILHLECGGLVLYHYRLEAGTFNLPPLDPDAHSIHFSWQELMLMINKTAPVTSTTSREKVQESG